MRPLVARWVQIDGSGGRKWLAQRMVGGGAARRLGPGRAEEGLSAGHRKEYSIMI